MLQLGLIQLYNAHQRQRLETLQTTDSSIVISRGKEVGEVKEFKGDGKRFDFGS